MPATKSKSKKSGKHTHYHKDGTVWARGYMQAGKMDGKWIWFRKDGTKMRSGSFTKGVQTGTWTTYDAKGKIVKVTRMKTSEKTKN